MQFERWWFILILALLLPALLLNLGLLPFIDDEGIRALVAREMHWSGNYIVPTLHGEYYYNKPPLWNWLLAAVFALAGRADEWTARLPAVACLLAYAATIFAVMRCHFGRQRAFLLALVFLTCGRILFWDSMLALIDIAFSWAMFGLFMVVYHAFERQRWWWLFLVSYLLTAVGFMLKGLPAIVFQGITLLTYFTYRGQWRRLFSPAHVVGGLLFLLLVGSYYLAYHQQNDLLTVWQTLFSESSKRTVVQYGLGETLVHLLAFPFEMVYHFLPWSLLLGYFIRRDIVALIRQDRFITYCLLIFLANLLPYWTSPEVYPRYLLMHAPLIFAVYLYLHERHRADNSLAYRTLHLLFGISLVGVVLLLPVVPWLEKTAVLPGVAWKSALLTLLAGALAVAYWRRAAWRWPAFIAALLVVRLAFDGFVLPLRNLPDKDANRVRTTATEVGRRLAGQPFFIWGETVMEPAASFYLEQAYGGIVPYHRDTTDLAAGYYLVDPAMHTLPAATVVDSVWARHHRHYFYVLARD